MQARNRGISPLRPRMMLERQNRETGEQVDDSWLNDVGPRIPLPSLSRRLNDIEDIATMPLSRIGKSIQDGPSRPLERRDAEQKVAATDEGVFLPTISRAEMIHLGPLAVLLKDERITEIVVLGPQRVVVKRDGTMHESIHHFTDEQQLVHTIEHLLHQAGQHIQAHQPLAQACLADGTRITVTMPPVSRTGPVLAIRKPTKTFQTLKELVRADMLGAPMADFLLACMQAQLNILVCGTTGTGKTTLLNALCATIPVHERIVSIENVAELRFSQPHVLTLFSSSGGPHAAVDATTRTLVSHALSMQPDRLVVGECRGDETSVLLQSLYNGQRGVLTTMYAHSVRDCLKRLVTLCGFGEKNVTVELLYNYIAHTFDVLLFLKRFSDGTRRLTNIVELLNEEKGAGKIQSIFYYQEATVRQMKGTFETSGFHSPLLAKIRSRL